MKCSHFALVFGVANGLAIFGALTDRMMLSRSSFTVGKMVAGDLTAGPNSSAEDLTALTQASHSSLSG